MQQQVHSSRRGQELLRERESELPRVREPPRVRGSSGAKVAARVQVRLSGRGSLPEKARVAEGQESLRQVKRDRAEGHQSARRLRRYKTVSVRHAFPASGVTSGGKLRVQNGVSGIFLDAVFEVVAQKEAQILLHRFTK